MRDQVVKSLVAECRKLALNYSRTDRALNTMNETYKIKRENIIILGEKTAAVVFDKYREGDPRWHQQALAVLFHVGHKGGSWLHLFVSYDHLYGIDKLKGMLHDIEQHNFANLCERAREETEGTAVRSDET